MFFFICFTAGEGNKKRSLLLSLFIILVMKQEQFLQPTTNWPGIGGYLSTRLTAVTEWKSEWFPVLRLHPPVIITERLNINICIQERLAPPLGYKSQYSFWSVTHWIYNWYWQTVTAFISDISTSLYLQTSGSDVFPFCFSECV